MPPATDPRFVRDGRPLREWLPELLGPDPATRRRAENAVSAMWWGALVADATAALNAPPDRDAHARAFADAVATAMVDPAFPGREYLESVLARIRADNREMHERLDLENRLMDAEFADDDADAPPLDDATRQSIEERVRQLYAAENTGRLPNSMGPHTLNIVLERSGPVLLRHPDLVRAALADPLVGGRIATALGSLGTAAAAFAPDLFATTAKAGGIAYPVALAAVGRDDPAIVRQLVDRVRTDAPRAAYAAADALAAIGPHAVHLVPTAVDELLPLLDDTDRGGFVLNCIAALGHDRRDVFDRVRAIAAPTPPDIRQVEGRPQYTFDAAMGRRGGAIDALGHFAAFADEAVTVLVDALATFTEYDPDWGYENGRHGRVMAALTRLPVEAAAAAVPTLVDRLRDDDDGEIDWRIIRFLAHLGPAARSALPALRRLNDDLRSEGRAPDDADAGDETLDPLGWAMQRIEATHP